MSDLITQPHFGTPGESPRQPYTPGDDFYELLLETHRDLGDSESRLVNARLILLLANHIGDLDVLSQALRAARAGIGPATEGKPAGPSPA